MHSYPGWLRTWILFMLSFVLLQYLNSDQTKPCPEIRIYYDIRVHDIERWFPSLMSSELFEEENTPLNPARK